MNLFDYRRQHLIETEAPLAARMRPRTLDEFVGQTHILGPGRLLRRAIQADQLSSLIFYGPPGTGKTTLARVIANSTKAHFIALNAVLAGIKDIRGAIEVAQARRGQQSQRTLLFVDEVHRFNKAQQDALLPWVENGTVILIGATTENPYFEVNKALVSRSRLFQLQPLNIDELRQVVQQALSDRDRGYGQKQIRLEPEALDHLVDVANGDARALLNALELAVETTPADPEGQIYISLDVAEESIQRRAVLYDKEGDAHFDTISAFIKSLRGSDPDAALYWLARMIYGGEDPRFLFRRMLILAGEDVGLADPQAIVVVNACAEAFDRVGLPEGLYPLAQAALYLANAPKSNSVLGFFDALKGVEQEQAEDIPPHLKDASRDRHALGHGAGYRYPHAYRDHWVAQQYLPRNLQGQVFYQPSDQGFEGQIRDRVGRHREAQLAASLEGLGGTVAEVLTFSPQDPSTDRWLQRSLGQVGQRLGQVRDRLFQLGQLQRHHVVLDLNAATGLLLWEALRQVPEGGVYACTRTPAEAAALQEQIAELPPLRRPIIFSSPLKDLPMSLKQEAAGVKFDRILGRNVLTPDSDPKAIARMLKKQLAPDGTLMLAETLARRSQRLYDWLDPTWLDADLYAQLIAAEDAIYTQEPGLSWDLEELEAAFTAAKFQVKSDLQVFVTDLHISPALIQRWFAPATDPPTYASRLAKHLTPDQVNTLHQIFVQRLCHQVLPWRSAIAFFQAA